jgi:hypothetical protein
VPAGRRTALAYVFTAAGLLALLYAWQRGAYPNYAEGVYLSSSRLILDGAVPYRDFVAAHPPLLFYSGAALLSAWDSIDGVRALLTLAPLVTGGLVATAVLRLTGSSPGSVLAGLAAILAPWSLHEHALLMPETFGAPLIMGAALLAARARTAVWAGLVAAVAVGFKWPFLLCGLALLTVTPARGRYLVGLAGGFAAGVLLSFLLFGAGRLYDDLVVAQQQVGWYSVHQVGAYAVQGAWNLLPLLVPAGFGLAFRDQARDPVLLRTLTAAALAALVLVGTIAKTGTYLNTIVLLEPPLVALAAAGAVWVIRAARPRWGFAAVAAALALTTVQVVSFVVAPDDPRWFLRPFSARGHVWTSADTAGLAVAAARRCPAGVAYSGQPFIAFVARRRMPGEEPDQFLMAKSPVASRAATKAAADTPRCP